MSNTHDTGRPARGQGGAVAPVAVGLGSNRGSRARHLASGRAAVGRLLSDLRCSRVYETAPVGGVEQPSFLNMCCVGRATVGPEALLAALLEAEARSGRDRSAEPPGGARTLDLDLLLYGARRADRRGLRLPHPRMAERAFVLAPLAELIPGAEVPGTGRTVRELAREAGTGGVEPLGELDDLLEGRDAADE